VKRPVAAIGNGTASEKDEIWQLGWARMMQYVSSHKQLPRRIELRTSSITSPTQDKRGAEPRWQLQDHRRAAAATNQAALRLRGEFANGQIEKIANRLITYPK
jgi:hypothetical protein